MRPTTHTAVDRATADGSSAVSSVQAERRRHPRFAIEERLELVGPDGQPSMGVLRDICAGGACILTPQSLKVGDGVILRGRLGGIRAFVRHMARVPEGRLIGVEFARPVRVNDTEVATWPAAW